jgi:iron complex transport system ATP-binding protein
MLNIENIAYSIKGKNILNNISENFIAGKINVILGPNGSGKSTLLKIISGEIVDFTGNVKYNQLNISSIGIKNLSKIRAVLTQQSVLQFPLTIEEIILMGRYPHFDFNPTRNDLKICQEVIDMFGLNNMKERNYLTLSGGEKQRVQFARVMAQVWENNATSNRYIFLDEPLNSLDIKYQKEFLELIKKFITPNTIVIAILHDINISIKYADKLHFMKEGKIIASGTSTDIIDTQLIKNVFGIEVDIIENPLDKSQKIVVI